MLDQLPTHQLFRLNNLQSPIHALTYSAGLSQYILTGGSDRQIRLYSLSKLSDNKPLQTYSAHGYEVLDIAVTNDNSRFASVGGDKTVFVWDVSQGITTRRFGGHGARVNAVDWNADASVVVSGSYDSTVRLWDTKAQSGKSLMTLSEARDSISALSVLEHEIVTGSIDGKVRSYDIRMGILSEDVIGYPVTSLTLTKQNDSYLVSSLDSTLRLIDKQDGKLLKDYKNPQFINNKYRVRSDLGLKDSVVISGDESGKIFMWDLLEGKLLQELNHQNIPTSHKPIISNHENGSRSSVHVISCVTFCRVRKEWASAAGDGTVTIWGFSE